MGSTREGAWRILSRGHINLSGQGRGGGWGGRGHVKKETKADCAEIPDSLALK